jgi:hypothetical protein
MLINWGNMNTVQNRETLFEVGRELGSCLVAKTQYNFNSSQNVAKLKLNSREVNAGNEVSRGIPQSLHLPLPIHCSQIISHSTQPRELEKCH